MDKISELQAWLSNRERKYARGIELFKLLASDAQKRKFLQFFNEVETTTQYDAHFTVLMNKLNMIAKLSGSVPLASNDDNNSDLIKDNTALQSEEILSKILKQESDLLDISDRLDDLEYSDNDVEADDLKDEIDHIKSSIAKLQDKYSILKPGAKIVTYTNLPEDMKHKFDRIREITPLYASLFAEMQNENLSDDEREPIATEAYNLWIERDQLWQDLDSWAEGKSVDMKVNIDTPAEDEETELLKGIKVANRIERLKENIHRAEVSIDMHEQNGKKKMKQKAEERLKAYQEELSKLQSLT